MNTQVPVFLELEVNLKVKPWGERMSHKIIFMSLHAGDAEFSVLAQTTGISSNG